MNALKLDGFSSWSREEADLPCCEGCRLEGHRYVRCQCLTCRIIVECVRASRRKQHLALRALTQRLLTSFEGEHPRGHEIVPGVLVEELRVAASTDICLACGREAPLVDDECPDCRH